MGDRDRTKTPPGGISERDRGSHQRYDSPAVSRTPSERELREMTPVHAISVVRGELKSEVTDVRGEVRDLRGQVDGLAGAFAEHREEVAGKLGDISGQLSVIPRALDALAKDRDAEREVDRIVTTTEVDVRKHRAITEIDDQAAAAKAKRELRNTIALRVFAIVSALVAGVLALLQAGKC